MNLRHRAVLLTIFIVLLLQFVLPTLAWISDGPSRWGWQMYSRPPDIPEVIVVDAGGKREPLELSDYVYRRRYELQYDGKAARQICDQTPDAVRIVMVSGRTGEEAEFTCGS